MRFTSIRAMVLGAALGLPLAAMAQEQEQAAPLKPVKLMTADGGAAPL
ncbi:MAG: efflux transporter periplasmic adaptor subunit, partial [Halobacteriovoraceae bacterium]|nr:efflux transporter periplasmic adaptor subunit [Halobacteriovoraceae bacterium]